MKHTRHRNNRLPALLPALLLALLLCACGSNSRTPRSGPADTLPVIGIRDIDPDTLPSSLPESTEAQPESTEPAPVITEAPEPTETPASAEAPEPSVPESTEAPTVPPTEPEPATVPPKSSSSGKRVWIGDSRFTGIHDTVAYDADRDYFISTWGAAYYWMINTALPSFNAYAALNQVDVVYWSLGASDIAKEQAAVNFETADKYSAALNDLIEKHPNTKFYILSYGPIGGDGKKPADIPDADAYNFSLNSFIDYVFTHSTASYIDQGEYIESTGYTTTDGRHYDAETNKRIYEYVLSQSGQ